MKPTERVTIRLSKQDLDSINTFVSAGEYSNRSEVIRRAVKEFIREHHAQVREGLEANAELQMAYLQIQKVQAQIDELNSKLAVLEQQ